MNAAACMVIPAGKMSQSIVLRISAAFLVISVAACGESATLPAEKGFGSNPTLPEPNPTWIPTVNIERPGAAAGFPDESHAKGEFKPSRRRRLQGSCAKHYFASMLTEVTFFTVACRAERRPINGAPINR